MPPSSRPASGALRLTLDVNGRKRAVKDRLALSGLVVRGGAEAEAGAIEPTRAVAAGRLHLGNELAPGEYVLQVTVTDPLAAKERG